MANLKSLAKETAIYGMSSIVGRFLNYLLVPLYTFALPASSGGYGVITNLYAITALLLVILTYGMETGFFRFANKEGERAETVYATTLLSVGTTSLVFLLGCLCLLHPIARALGYEAHPWYIGMMLIVVAMDAFQAIPFAYLRYRKRPLRFAALKLLFIFTNIALNLLYYVGLKGKNVGATFAINLVCTSLVMVCLLPQLTGFRYVFDKALLGRMLRYSFPILILGIAGVLNQVADKIIFRFVYPGSADEANIQLGIYGAASKIAMIMAMLTQAFRFAYEPFVFSKSREKDSKEMYAKAMKFFIIFTLLAFLSVMFYLDVLRYILSPGYWEGLCVVPVVMAAEIFMGVYFNLSFWYKLIDQTRWGAYFSLAGCAVIILTNVFLVPVYSYMACAWAGFFGYGLAMVLSYVVGQRKYPIRYELKRIGSYVLLAGVLYAAGMYLPVDNLLLRLTLRTLLLLVFVGYLIKTDFPLSQIPIINRFIKK